MLDLSHPTTQGVLVWERGRAKCERARVFKPCSPATAIQATRPGQQPLEGARLEYQIQNPSLRQRSVQLFIPYRGRSYRVGGGLSIRARWKGTASPMFARLCLYVC